MKFTCLQENLSKGLQIVTRAIPAKSSLPILANVLIATENGRIKLSATNLETAITTYIGASVKEEGSITVPAKLLKDFIINLSPSTVEVTLDNETLHITSQKTKSKFNGNSAIDYPELPSFPEDLEFITINPRLFNDAVAVVAFASGTDSTRPMFTGVYVNFKENKLTLTSTDGFRLSEKVISPEAGVKEFTTIIPAKSLMEVAKIFSTSEESLKIGMSSEENLALFKSEDTFVATRIIDGNYLDYKRIIPTAHMLTANFSSGEFLEAVRLTNIFAKEGNSTLKIRFDPQNNVIKVTSLSEETGEHESQLNAELEGELLDIAFNSKYLLDFLGNVKADKIHFSTNGNITACLLKPENDTDFMHVIMPLQI